MDELSKLEYRRDDSAGIAVRDGKKLVEVIKATGKLRNLSDKTDAGRAIRGTCGIGHTRWAAHDAPSQTNAHPHVSVITPGLDQVPWNLRLLVYITVLLRTTRS